MIIELFLLLFGISILLFIGGFYYSGDFKYGSQLFIFISSFILLMLGLIILTEGISFHTGESVINDVKFSSEIPYISSYNMTYIYDNSIKGGYLSSYGITAIFIFLGLGGMIYAFLGFKKKEREGLVFSEEEE